MNNIFTIMKKELKRFFGDKRMLITLFMPGILIFVIYTLMGSFISDAFTANNEHVYQVYTSNVPDEYKNVFDGFEYEIIYNEEIKDDSEAKQAIIDKQLDLVLIFEQDLDSTYNIPKVSLFYNSSSPESVAIYSYAHTKLLALGSNITYNFLVNMDENIKYDLATNEDLSISIITMMLPYLLLIFLFTGCVSISTESIAGEKERGTIATLLLTPTKRKDIAIGKILALSLTSLVSSVVSFLGVISSLPNLLQGSGDLTLSMYGIDTYLCILGIIFVTVIFFTTVLSIISTFAKNVKEASQWSSMLMVLVMVLGITSMVKTGGEVNNLLVYFIPVYNCVTCMGSVFSLTIDPICFIITILSNIVYISIGVFILAKMFNSEKIMSTN